MKCKQMLVKSKSKEDSGEKCKPLLILGALFECKCGEYIKMQEINQHQNTCHPGKDCEFVRVSLMGRDGDNGNLECWSDWITVCGCEDSCGVPYCMMYEDEDRN